jgi:8-oxo-dGTP diphosphatase
VRREYPEAPIIGVGAVVIDEGNVLLVRRGQEPLKGEWSLPGGALELGETLEQGVVREVCEETGLIVAPAGIVEVLDRITLDRIFLGEPSGRVRYHYVLVDFLCHVAGGTLRSGSDAEEARWAPREELNERGFYRLAPVTVRVIEKAFRQEKAFRLGQVSDLSGGKENEA